MTIARKHRRDFLKKALCAAAGSSAFSSVWAKMNLAQGAAPRILKGAGSNYRALVCLDLSGGNDCFNTIVPNTSNDYATYAATRSNLAVPQGQLLPLNGTDYGLHPQMPGVQELFNNNLAAVVANVGPLLRPVDKAMVQTPGTLLPPQLYSHSDQSVLWQTPRADETARRGWGGRLADIFAASNENPVLSMNISLDGENVFQAGNIVSPYFMSAFGVEEIDVIQTGAPDCADGGEGWNRRRCLTFRSLRDLDHSHPFERAYADIMRGTMATSAQVREAIAQFPENAAVFRPFWDRAGLPWDPDNLAELPWLAQQLLMVARVIQARSALQMSRQLFFVRLGGFDTHAAQLADHPPLLADLSASITAFYDIMESTEFDLANDVTAFTVSEFGRTLTINGDGTDHGWGGHHFVFGGAVNGGQIYGNMPNLEASENNPDDAGWGQIIPTLSVDQYAATLASWYGLDSADRDAIFSNLTYMSGPLLSIEGGDLGFMQVS